MDILLKGLRFVNKEGTVINTGSDFEIMKLVPGDNLVSLDLATLNDFVELVEAKEADGRPALNEKGEVIIVRIPYTEKVEGNVVVVFNVNMDTGKLKSDKQVDPTDFEFKGYEIETVRDNLDSDSFEDENIGHLKHVYRHQTYPVGARKKKRSKNKAASKARRNNRK